MPNFIKCFWYVKKHTLNVCSWSNDLFIPWVIDRTWLMQESPVLNPDWLVKIRWFVIYNHFSKSKSGITRVFFIIQNIFRIKPVCFEEYMTSSNLFWCSGIIFLCSIIRLVYIVRKLFLFATKGILNKVSYSSKFDAIFRTVLLKGETISFIFY